MSKLSASSGAHLALLLGASIPLAICTAFLAMLAFPLFMVLVAVSAAGPFCQGLTARAHRLLHEVRSTTGWQSLVGINSVLGLQRMHRRM